MINYFAKEDFTRHVFITEGDLVAERVLLDLCEEYAEQCCSPRGVTARFFTDGKALKRWEPNGSQSVVMEFASDAEAEHALRLSWLHDLTSSDNGPVLYNTRGDAMADLIMDADLIDNDDIPAVPGL